MKKQIYGGLFGFGDDAQITQSPEEQVMTTIQELSQKNPIALNEALKKTNIINSLKSQFNTQLKDLAVPVGNVSEASIQNWISKVVNTGASMNEIRQTYGKYPELITLVEKNINANKLLQQQTNELKKATNALKSQSNNKSNNKKNETDTDLGYLKSISGGSCWSNNAKRKTTSGGGRKMGGTCGSTMPVTTSGGSRKRGGSCGSTMPVTTSGGRKRGGSCGSCGFFDYY